MRSASPRSGPVRRLWGRTVGLVSPVAAEYRLLGANQPFLATLRAATNGREVATPLEPWRHDLKLTSSFTELWPWLLLLALLLFPLDIALRRVSLGRRELADGRAWIGRRWRARSATGARTASAAGMLSARDRVAGAGARAAILRARDEASSVLGESAATASAGTSGHAAPSTEIRTSAAADPATRTVTPAGPSLAPSGPAALKPSAPETAKPQSDDQAGSDTLARLREAKRRTRDRGS